MDTPNAASAQAADDLEIRYIEFLVDLTLSGFERGHGDLRTWRTRVIVNYGLHLREIGGYTQMVASINRDRALEAGDVGAAHRRLGIFLGERRQDLEGLMNGIALHPPARAPPHQE